MKYLIILTLVLFFKFTNGQEKKWTFIVNSEEKLSLANASFNNIAQTRNILRYSSGFSNFYFKNHYNFTEKVHLGLSIGFNNLGHIFELNDSIRFKQRMLAIPAGLQMSFGDLKDKNFFFGCEALLPFHYKQKTWQEGRGKDKVKSSEWFGRQNQITPMVFIGYQYSGQGYIRFSYQLSSFINPNYNFNVRGINTFINSDNVFELCFGTLLNNQKKRKMKPLDDAKDIEMEI